MNTLNPFEHSILILILILIQAELIAKVEELNALPTCHGILVQLPLPEHINENAVIGAISVSKDVDGLHPINSAKLVNTGTHKGAEKVNWTDLSSVPFHIACTPQGCIELLDRSGVEMSGKNAVVIGRSNLVGLPVSLLLMHRNATVTIVHSRTVNAEEICKRADIVVAAVGRTEMVKGSWIKEGGELQFVTVRYSSLQFVPGRYRSLQVFKVRYRSTSRAKIHKITNLNTKLPSFSCRY